MSAETNTADSIKQSQSEGEGADTHEQERVQLQDEKAPINIAELVRLALAEANLDLNVGDEFISNDGYGYRVAAIGPTENSGGSIVISIESGNGSQWCSYSTQKISGWGSYIRSRQWVKVERPLKELLALPATELDRILEQERKIEELEVENLTTAVVVRESGLALVALKKALETRRDRIAVVRSLINRKMALAAHYMDELQKKITYLRKLIEVGELYLGIGEMVVTLREGAHASADVPITLMQNILWMDEEVGIVNMYNGRSYGLDWQEIDCFDEWLLQSDHLDRILPVEKGIVLLRVTRQDNDSRYSSNPWFNAKLDAENRRIYALIRNGEAVYRVYTQLAGIEDRMYPTNAEWAHLMAILTDQDIEDERYHLSGSGTLETVKYMRKPGQSDIDRAKDLEFRFKKTVALLQGLLDRSEALQPLPHEISLFDPDTYQDGSVVFIRDAEPALSDGQETYRAWRARINANISVGSRIYISRIRDFNPNSKDDYGYWRSRFVFYANWYPSAPEPGVYDVEEMPVRFQSKDWPNSFRVMYNPGDEIWYKKDEYGDVVYDPHNRVRRITFRVMPNDEFVLNYDEIDIPIIDRFIADRNERSHYIAMLPVLYGIRELRLAEKEREAHFVGLVANRLGVTEAAVWQAVDWWKTKNKWKRGLSKDDSLALRMIERRLTRQMKGATSEEDREASKPLR